MEDDEVLEQFRTHEDIRVVVDKLIKNIAMLKIIS